MKKIVFLISILLIGIIIFIVRVNESEYSIDLIIGSEVVNINNNSNKEINMTSLQAEEILKIRKTGDYKVKINGKILSDELELENTFISNNDKIEVEVFLTPMKKCIYYINTLPSDFPKYKIEGKSSYEGDYYMTTYNNLEPPYYLFKLNEEGDILYYKKTDNVVFDFKKEIVGDTIKYSYLEVVKNEMDTESNSYCPTKLVIMDEKYNIIDEIRYLNSDKTIQPLENHGGLILGENHYILATFDEIEVENIPNRNGEKVKITNNKIEEIKDGKIIWEFQTIDYPNLYEYCTEERVWKNKYNYADYAHYNSCAIDKNDGNLLCSFRNIDAIIKIDRKNGKIAWILGGEGDQFGLDNNQKFAKQHAVTSMENDTILLFDNGNTGKNSRIVKIKLNEKENKIIQYESIDLFTKSIFMGSVQELDKNVYTICYGGGYYMKNLIEEIDVKQNKTYFSFDFESSKYMYRVYKIK